MKVNNDNTNRVTDPSPPPSSLCPPRFVKDHEFTAIWTLDESTPGVAPLTLDGPTSMGCQMVSAAVAERVAQGMANGGRAGAEVLFEVKRWPGWDQAEQTGGTQYPRWAPPGGGSGGGNIDTDSWATDVPVRAGEDGGDKWDNVFGGGRGGRGGRGDGSEEGTAAEEAEEVEGAAPVEAEGDGYRPLRILPPPKERVPVLAPKPSEPRGTEGGEQKRATPKPTTPAAVEEEVVNSWEALLSDDEEEEGEGAGDAEAEAGDGASPAATAGSDGGAGGGGDGRNDVFEARALQLVEMGYDKERASWAVAETTQSEAWLEAAMELLLGGN